MSLTRLEDSYWTSEAFFVSSLVTRSLSVFFSCAISLAFHGLHSADLVKDFLTTPAAASTQVVLRRQFSMLKKSPSPTMEAIAELRECIHKERWKVASAQSAIMLVVPITLLNLALNAFLIGLGIYLGQLYTKKLVPSYGKGSLGILIFFLISAVVGIGAFYIPQGLKQREIDLFRGWVQTLAGFADQTLPMQPTEGIIGNDQANGRDETRGSPITFPQSTHERRDGRTRYAVGNNVIERDREEVNPYSPNLMRMTGREDLLPSAKRPGHEFTAGHEDQTENAEQPAVTPPSQSVRSALVNLIKAQEESFRASSQVLEAFDALSEANLRLPS